MSRPLQEVLVCPHCGVSNPVTVWASVNPTVDPQLKEELLRGDLTTYVCNGCTRRNSLLFELLYHDMAKELLIWLVPDGIQSKEPRALALLEIFGGDYTRRLVRTVHKLTEKVRCFDAGLDDRVLELVKLSAWAHYSSGSTPPDTFLFAELTEGPEERSLVFVLAGDSPDWPSVELSVDVYNDWRTRAAPFLVPDHTSSLAWSEVDTTYGLQLGARILGGHLGAAPPVDASLRPDPTKPAEVPATPAPRTAMTQEPPTSGQGSIAVAARWLVFLPAAALSGWAAWFLVTLINRITFSMQDINPNWLISKLYIEAAASGAMGAAAVWAGAKVAPSHRRAVVFVLAGLVILAGGFFLFPAVVTGSGWAVYSCAWIVVGAGVIAYGVYKGDEL